MSLTESAFDLIKETTRTRFNGNLSEAAKFFGVNYQTFHSWMNREGRIPSWRSLAPALEALRAELRVPDDNFAEYELVKKVVAKAGAGSSLITSGEIDGLYAFRSDFFGKNNLQAKKCILLEVLGDSMRPTLENGDLILVDTKDRGIQDGRIYLVAVNEELLVKRIFRAPTGILLRSDNKDFPEMPVLSADTSNCVVHGRVRWVGKEL